MKDASLILTLLLAVGCSKLVEPTVFRAENTPPHATITAFTGDATALKVSGRDGKLDVPAGHEVTLTVTSTNGDLGLISPIGVFMLNGDIDVIPWETTTYIFSVVDTHVNTSGLVVTTTIHDSVTVMVTPPDAPSASIDAAPATIEAGDTTTLTVTSENADDGVIFPIGQPIVNGSVVVTPAQTTTYFFSVTGLGGTAHDSITVVVEGVEACGTRPIAAITASRSSINRGEEVTLSVESTDADQGMVVPTATEMLNGSFAVSPEYTTTYLFVADGLCGSAHDAVTVEVVQLPRPTATIQATPAKITKASKPVVLTMTSTDADFGMLVPPGTSIPVNQLFTLTVTPQKTTTYLFAVDGAGGSAHATVTVEVGTCSSSQTGGGGCN